MATYISDLLIRNRMDPAVVSGLIVLGIVAGALGALFGVGGGIIFIPVLTIVYDLPAVEAAAISLVGILATSAGAAAYYAEHKVANIRLGLYLEIGTCVGAIMGAMVAGMIEQWVVMVVFAAFVLLNAARMLLSHGKDCGSIDGEHEFHVHDMKTGQVIGYDVERKAAGSIICVLAGMYSSITGVGGGVIKVPVMNNFMNVPLKAATATSSYMIGITAFSGAMVYFIDGAINLEFAACVAIGAFIGMILGTRASRHFDTGALKKYFSLVLIASAISVLMKVGGVL